MKLGLIKSNQIAPALRWMQMMQVTYCVISIIIKPTMIIYQRTLCSLSFKNAN